MRRLRTRALRVSPGARRASPPTSSTPPVRWRPTLFAPCANAPVQAMLSSCSARGTSRCLAARRRRFGGRCLRSRTCPPIRWPMCGTTWQAKAPLPLLASPVASSALTFPAPDDFAPCCRRRARQTAPQPSLHSASERTTPRASTFRHLPTRRPLHRRGDNGDGVDLSQ